MTADNSDGEWLNWIFGFYDILEVNRAAGYGQMPSRARVARELAEIARGNARRVIFMKHLGQADEVGAETVY